MKSKKTSFADDNRRFADDHRRNGQPLKPDSVRLPMPLGWTSDSNTAFNLKRCDRIFRRTFDRLIVAQHRAKITVPVVFPSHSKDDAHLNVLPINGKTPFLLHLYDDALCQALKAGDAQLAALLGIQLGQLSAGLPLNEVVRRELAARLGWSKRDPEKLKERNQCQQKFETYVQAEYAAYAKICHKRNRAASISDFRRLRIPKLIDLASSDDETERMVAKKLMGTSGANGDGMISAKQLGRIVRKTRQSSETHS